MLPWYRATNSTREDADRGLKKGGGLMLNNSISGLVRRLWGSRVSGDAASSANQSGTVRFRDGQTGAAAAFNGYNALYLLRTNE